MGLNKVDLSTSRPNKTYCGRPLSGGDMCVCMLRIGMAFDISSKQSYQMITSPFLGLVIDCDDFNSLSSPIIVYFYSVIV